MTARCFTANCRRKIRRDCNNCIPTFAPFIAAGIATSTSWWFHFAHIYIRLIGNRSLSPIVPIEISRSRPLFLSVSRFFFSLYRSFHFRVLQPINPLRFFLRKSKTWLRRMYRVTLRSSSIISYRARASFSFYFEWRLHIHYPPLHLHAFPQRS